MKGECLCKILKSALFDKVRGVGPIDFGYINCPKHGVQKIGFTVKNLTVEIEKPNDRLVRMLKGEFGKEIQAKVKRGYLEAVKGLKQG